MKRLLLLSLLFVSLAVHAQEEGDTVYSRCPVSVLDTLTGNNYFIAHQPATVKVYRDHGELVIVIEQRGQFFTMFFHAKHLRNKRKYIISTDDRGRKELTAKYSFRSGESVAYINLSKGTATTNYDETTKLWHIVVTGLIANMGETRVTYFKARADFYIE